MSATQSFCPVCHWNDAGDEVMTKQNDDGVITDDNATPRCWWCGSDPEYVRYHDDEWGMPVDDDRRLFEKIVLEGFQSGLSWLTILRKRDNFRRAFADFDFHRVAAFDDADVQRLVGDAGIVRHRGKIRSAINNARQAVAAVDHHGSLAKWFWSFEPERSAPIQRRDEVPAITDESKAMAKTLKKAGWTFVGPTTCYAFMQSMGMVNDHIIGCRTYHKVESARKKFKRP
nr:DNA-3-methyladenine glycosylase I [Crateriforma spongiae]